MKADYTEYYKFLENNPPDGVHCIWCGAELPGKRRKYCSDKCREHVYDLVTTWEDIRQRTMRRDGYMCTQCGEKVGKDSNGYWVQPVIKHTIPPSKGGAVFDVDNCKTYCRNCTLNPNKKVYWAKRKENVEEIKEEIKKNGYFNVPSGFLMTFGDPVMGPVTLVTHNYELYTIEDHWNQKYVMAWLYTVRHYNKIPANSVDVTWVLTSKEENLQNLAQVDPEMAVTIGLTE